MEDRWKDEYLVISGEVEVVLRKGIRYLDEIIGSKIENLVYLI